MLNQIKARQVWVPALLYSLIYLDCHELKGNLKGVQLLCEKHGQTL